MNVRCSRCGSELRYPGALLFSPPVNDDVRKMHLCQSCFDELVGWITGEGGLTCGADYRRLIGPTAHLVPESSCMLPFGHEGEHGAVLADGTVQYPQPEPLPSLKSHPALMDTVTGRARARPWWRGR